MSTAHIKYIGFYLFKTMVEQKQYKDHNIKPILLDLVRIQGLKCLTEDCGAVFDSGFYCSSANTNMEQALDILIKRMRPHLIPVVESFAYPDEIVPSSIGNSYGDIYEQQLSWAMDSALNHEDQDGVPKTFEQYIKPFMHEEIMATKAKL